METVFAVAPLYTYPAERVHDAQEPAKLDAAKECQLY
jgi:hypothetical protein